MPPYVRSQKKLAAAIGVSPGTITNWVRQRWAPVKGAQGHDVATWLEIKRRVRSKELDLVPYKPVEPRKGRRAAPKRYPGTTSPGGPPPDPSPSETEQPAGVPSAPAPEPLSEEEDAAVATLREASTPLEIARATVKLASHELARARVAGEAMTKANVGALKQALEELRRTEVEANKTAVKQGHLLPRTVLRATAGRLGRLMLQGVEQWSSDVATKVQLWAADEDFRGQPAAVQRALVQDWARSSQRALREAVVAQLDEIIEQCRKEGS